MINSHPILRVSWKAHMTDSPQTVTAPSLGWVDIIRCEKPVDR
jgi:hypothetical protein